MSPREAEYAAKGVEILAVNAFETPDSGRKFIDGEGKDLGLHWAFADDAVTEALGVKAVPTQILMKNGEIVWTSSMSSIVGGADAIFAEIDKVL